MPADDTVVYSYPGATGYDTFSTDDVGGKKYQRVKLDGGASGLTVPITAGQKVMAQSVPVTLASDQPAPAVKRPSSSTVASVAYSTTNVTLLASNANRLGATIYNGGSTNLIVKLGANAATTATLVIVSGGYYEVPFNYTGIIDGMWLAGGSGAASVTELLP